MIYFALLFAAFTGAALAYVPRWIAYREGLKYGYQTGLLQGSACKVQLEEANHEIRGRVYIDCMIDIPPKGYP